MVDALREEGVEARGRAADGRDFTGVWVGERKIGSIGLHVSHGVTMHGLSLNVDGDLAPFEWIVPCGLGGVAMTSVAAETRSRRGRLDCLRKRVALRPRAERSAPVSGSSRRQALERALDAVPSPVG